MAMEKGLYAAPEGIEALTDQPDMEIEIVNPEEVHIAVDGMEIDIMPAEESDFDINLAEEMPESVLGSLAAELTSDYEEDVSSRKDWIQTYVDGLELLGLKIETRSEPWEGACGVYHPLMAEALVKFQSEMMMATFPAAGPVKTQIIGKETPEKKASAERVQVDMNYQLTDVMTEYRPEHERMLWGLGLSGNAFKKVYFDPHLDRQVSIFVPAEDLVVPYGASNLQSAERVTHVMRKTSNDVRRLQVSGFWRDIDLGEPDIVLDEVEKKIAEKLGFRATTDDRHKILEMCVDLDLAGYEHTDEDGEPTGIAIPYIVTIDKSSGKVLAIRRNWKEGDELHTKLQHFVHYGYVPGFGFYHFGLVHLVGAFAKSGTSLLRQLVDAGTLSNLPGGFKARGMRVKGDDTPIAPGEFRDVDVPSGTIKDNLMTLPYKEPSQTLLALLNQIIEDGRRFANAADLQISDMSSQAPVGTTLAILERTLKVMSAVQARIHYSMQQELVLLKEIIAESALDDYNYDPESGSRRAKKSDYENCDVIPVSDPNAATMAQKIVQYQAVLQLAQSAPQMYNMPLLHRQMLDVLGIKNAQKLIPMSEDQKPMDPVSENQNILMGKPVKAFLYQDHEAHITVHMTAMNDPKIQQLMQGNPMAQAMQAQMMAHINEHLGFEYRKQIEQQLGMNLPPQHDEGGEDVQLDPMVEARLAPLLAQASKQLLQSNQAFVAQQQAQQQAQDPIIQMQQQELQLKAAEQQRKVQKDQVDAQLKMKQLEIEHERIVSQAKTAEQQAKIGALKSVAENENQRKLAEVRLKQDSLKTVANLENQRMVTKQKLFADGLKAAHMVNKEKPTKGD
jgi:chaperonin GroES